jgi:hypothetical protein
MADKVEEIASRDGLLSPDRPDLGAHPALCPVVGVGASAGGLEAFHTLLAAAPADAGFAYVLVQHLDPNHESMLGELLARRTSMPVRQISDNMADRAQLFLPHTTERQSHDRKGDLLINVTCFFRDAEAFDLLRREVIPELLRDKARATRYGSGLRDVRAASKPTASPS